jgi:TM2 domain-containing membrane protein YozV
LFDCPVPPGPIECPSVGSIKVNCWKADGFDCDGERTREIKCVPTEGKDPGTALVLSVLLGWCGADRFYLGYYSIGVFKLITGGFFAMGWYLDIFLIGTRLLSPAHGVVWKLRESGGLSTVRLPGPAYWLA